MSERHEVVLASATLVLGDCLDVLREMPDGSVDAVVTDPPYGIGVADWDDLPLQQEFLSEFLRVSKGAVIAFGSPRPAHVKAVLDLDPPADRLLVWDVTFGFSKSRSNGMFYHWHPIYAWRLGKADRGDDVFRLPTAVSEGNDFYHPGTKPVRLMRQVLALVPDAQTVLDPFMGSGTTGIACHLDGRTFMGIEIDAGYFDIAERRLEAARQQPRLF